MKDSTKSQAASVAFRFVLAMGIVNLFADMTYEGGGSINGPFMGSLGASAAVIGIVAGVGEFLGYAIRLPAGYLSDKTGSVWLLTFIGYTINLLAVPALAFAGNWQSAALLVIAERIGRAIRKPNVESMLSYATGELGKGWVFALNTALDEVGATVGPLLVALILYLKGSYHAAYAFLFISAVLALAALTTARWEFPNPSGLAGRTLHTRSFNPAYWLSMGAGACLAAGLISFELISYHFAHTGVVSTRWIPILLAISTAAGIVASLVFGKLYDRIGVTIILGAVILSSGFAPLVFLGDFYAAIFGLVLWGLGYATQDTLLKALVADLLPDRKRNLAFGLFYAGYGVGWLAGSITTGMLYDRSIFGVVVFSVLMQLLSLPLFIMARTRLRPS